MTKAIMAVAVTGMDTRHTADITVIRGMAVGTTIGTMMTGVIGAMIMTVGRVVDGVMKVDGAAVMNGMAAVVMSGTVAAAGIRSPMKDMAGTITADRTRHRTSPTIV
jgi:hypothetical protein